MAKSDSKQELEVAVNCIDSWENKSCVSMAQRELAMKYLWCARNTSYHNALISILNTNPGECVPTGFDVDQIINLVITQVNNNV